MKFAYSHHLVGLVARVEAANTRLAAADPDRRARLAGAARRRSAALSARLDGSPLRDDTIADVDAGHVPTFDAVPEGAGSGWARAVRLDSLEVQQMAAIEYANLCSLTAVEGRLASRVFDEPRRVMQTLHGHIVQGLVDPTVIGRPRQTEQAVHDGTQGMVIYAAPAPERAAEMLTELDRWLRKKVLTVHPVLLAAVAHERILQAQPFEAGNGRLARATARLIMVARGIDPVGAAVLEEEAAADPGGYYAEVAATIRRADNVLRWLERDVGAVARAMEHAADTMDPRPSPGLPDRGRSLITRLLPGSTINVRTYAADAGVTLRVARDDLEAFARGGQVVEVPDGHGLIYRRAT